jgi:hypothetical protein
MKRNIKAFGNSNMIYSVIVACFREDITIFVSLDINKPKVEVHEKLALVWLMSDNIMQYALCCKQHSTAGDAECTDWPSVYLLSVPQLQKDAGSKVRNLEWAHGED